MKEVQSCPICKRELGKINISKHHLVPKSEGGKDGEIVLIHNICHQKIHSLFTLKELKESLNSIEQLTSHEEMVKFIKWVSKKDPSFYQSNKRAKRKIKQGRQLSPPTQFSFTSSAHPANDIHSD